MICYIKIDNWCLREAVSLNKTFWRDIQYVSHSNTKTNFESSLWPLQNFQSKSNLASLLVSGRCCNYSDTPQPWMCQKLGWTTKLAHVQKETVEGLACVRAVARLAEFSPGGITFHCWAISIVKGKNSAMSSLWHILKALLSLWKESEVSESALLA